MMGIIASSSLIKFDRLQFFSDSASHHQKKIGRGRQGFALHPKIKLKHDRIDFFFCIQREIHPSAGRTSWRNNIDLLRRKERRSL